MAALAYRKANTDGRYSRLASGTSGCRTTRLRRIPGSIRSSIACAIRAGKGPLLGSRTLVPGVEKKVLEL